MNRNELRTYTNKEIKDIVRLSFVTFFKNFKGFRLDKLIVTKNQNEITKELVGKDLHNLSDYERDTIFLKQPDQYLFFIKVKNDNISVFDYRLSYEADSVDQITLYINELTKRIIQNLQRIDF